MNVRIRTSETTPTLAQSEFIRRRLEYALGLHEADIDQVDTWLIAIDRGRQGPASYCKVDVTLGNGMRVSSEGTERDFHLAVHRAADRAGWEVSRSLGRQLRQPPDQAIGAAARSSPGSGTTRLLAQAG